MREAGFTHHPVPEPTTLAADLGLTDRQFKEQYGWGTSTLIDYRQGLQAMAAKDPNQAELAAMSEAERSAHGQAMEACRRRIVIELGVVPDGALRLPTDSALNEAITNAIEATNADPRVIDVGTQWSECMRGQGFPYSRGEELQSDLHSRAAPFEQAYIAQGQPLVAAGTSWADLTIGEVLTAAQINQIERVQVFELAAAAADLACIDQGIDVAQVSADVYREHEDKALDGL
jgi:hypothetical protein